MLILNSTSPAKPSSSRAIRIRPNHCLVADETYKVDWEQRGRIEWGRESCMGVWLILWRTASDNCRLM